MQLYFHIATVTLLILFSTIGHVKCSLVDTPLSVRPRTVDVVVGQHNTVEFFYKEELHHEIEVGLAASSELSIAPSNISLSLKNKSALVTVSGLSVTSRSIVEVKTCSALVNDTKTNCSFEWISVFVEVKVVKSSVLSFLVNFTGWIYFAAWSISFYPQIYLNYMRKSVIGLNFDFLVLNTIGFFCYAVYNILFYFDKNVQEIYLENNVHALIPVLLNDVFFSTHALIVCIVTGLQCFIYERGNQRISYICHGWGSFLVAFSVVSLVITIFRLINWLQFIYFLSSVKLAITLSKYFPQAILNYKRKSTVGWSIGNILLDLSGGVMDIFQMILQASNTDDWTAFYGNPVKFGLGFVSILFDVFFIIQHYILYRHPMDESNYDEVGNYETSPSLNPVDA